MFCGIEQVSLWERDVRRQGLLGQFLVLATAVTKAEAESYIKFKIHI